MPTRLLVSAALLLAGALAILAFLLVRESKPAPAQNVAPAEDAPGATWPAGARRAPEFNLTDQDGAPVSLARFRGRPVIVTFIDPLCRNFCPLEGRRLNRVIRRFPVATRPAIVAVSVNVAGNAPSILHTVDEKWNLAPQWRWAVGDESQLAPVWRKYHIGVMAQRKTMAGVTVNDVAHTEAAYVVDANGFERALFLWPYTADGVERVLRDLAPTAS